MSKQEEKEKEDKEELQKEVETKGDETPSWVNQLLNKLDSLADKLEQEEDKPQKVKVPEPLPATPEPQEIEPPEIEPPKPQEKETKKKSFLDWLM